LVDVKRKQVQERANKSGVPWEYIEPTDPSWLIPKGEYKSRWNAPIERQEPEFRRSRWGPAKPLPGQRKKYLDDEEFTFTAQTFSYLPIFEKSTHEIEVLIRKHRIDDLSKRIIMGDYENRNDPDLRSPSPPPKYDAKTGEKLNPRENRLKERHLRERQLLIAEVLRMDPDYLPPPDYKPPKKTARIYLPVPKEGDLPINYVGQIIGPQGSTLKKLEKESKCKIKLRGAGSEKEEVERNFERELLELDGQF
jgi:splicing factor 1